MPETVIIFGVFALQNTFILTWHIDGGAVIITPILLMRDLGLRKETEVTRCQRKGQS